MQKESSTSEKPIAVLKYKENEYKFWTDDDVAKFIVEQKPPFEMVEGLGEIFPNIYPLTVEYRLQRIYGMVMNVEGTVNTKDNVNYLTVWMFAKFTEFDRGVCEMLCNHKNKELSRQIIDIGYPMMYLLTKGKK